MIDIRHMALCILLLLPASLYPQAQTVEMDPGLAQAEQLYRREGAATALPEFERLLREFQEANAAVNIALTQGYIGECYWRLGDFDLAREHLDKALSLKQELGDRYQAAKTLNVLGLLEWDLGNFDMAIDRFREANAIGREMGDRKLEGATLNNLSMVYDELGDYDRSLAQYGEVLEIYSGIDFPRGEGDTLGNIGGVHLLLGHYRDAIRYYGEALEISQDLESVPAMSQDHGNLGLAYGGLGQTEESIRHLDTALILAEQAGMQQEKGLWLRGRANAQIRAGRYDLGLEDHREAIGIYKEIGAQALLLEALHDMGELQLELGDPESAERYFKQAIEIARDIDFARGITVNLIALGDIQLHYERLDAAEALYLQALGRSVASGEENFQCTSHLRLARLHLERDSYKQATSEIGAALVLAQKAGALVDETEAVFLRGELEREQGQLAAALEHYASAFGLASRLADPDLLWQTEYGRGLALGAAGRKEEAVAALKNSVGHIESVRNRLRESRYRSGYLQDKHDVYLELVRLQLELGKNGEAFTTAEQLRAWSFTTQSGHSSYGRQLSDEQHLRETELQERIRQLQRVLDEENQKATPERRQLAVDTFSRELMAVEREYQSFLDDVHSNGALEYSPDTGVLPAVLQASLQPGEALVEYIVGPDSVMIFVLTGQQLHATGVGVDRSDLHARMELLQDLLQQSSGEQWKKPAAGLSSILIDPIVEEGWLDDIAQLFLVPHEILNYLPFALLSTGEGASRRFVLDTYYTSYLPAAVALEALYEKRTEQSSLLAAVPARSRLRHAPDEVQAISEMFNPHARVLAGDEASETSFKQLAGDYRYLHLATHGHFNRMNPLLSALELEPDEAEDGMLEVHEIFGLELQADLVTLSACETGMGSGYLADFPAGDEFVSLTRAFLQAGGASVLATLWAVDDRSTVNLMKDFYRRLQEPGALHDKAVALADAQRALRLSGEYEHPYYWAPFVLVGNSYAGPGVE